MGVNILDVEHHRTGVRLGVEEAEILLTLETGRHRGAARRGGDLA